MSVVRVTSLLFYFSFADLLSFSLPALILWEFFSETQSGSSFCAEIFVTLLNAFMQENKFLKFLGFMWNPLSWVMEAAALMPIVLANGQVWWSIFFIWFLLWCYHWFCFVFSVCVFPCLLHFWLWLQFCVKYISRASHQIGRIFWGSYSCWLWTLL